MVVWYCVNLQSLGGIRLLHDVHVIHLYWESVIRTIQRERSKERFHFPERMHSTETQFLGAVLSLVAHEWHHVFKHKERWLWF